jgi:DNA-directed RNA polymerase subunit M/transcription elongation factor TFIIS
MGICKICRKVVFLTCPLHANKGEKLIIDREEKDVLDKETSEKTICKCFSCNNTECYYRLVQNRSADEPETIFLKCTKCHNEWKK